MKFLSGNGKGCSSVCKKTACAFLMAMLLNLPASASEKLREIGVTGYGENGLMLFPAHEITEFNASMETPEVFQADLYDFELETGSKIVPTPHPMVKFMRVSQVSTSPDVVRATLVFNEKVNATPKLVDNKLVVEASAVKSAKSSKKTTSARKSSVDTISSFNSVSDNAAFASSSAGKTVLDQKVSLSFEQEDLLTILNALAAKFDLRIFADAGVKGKMSVNAQDVTLRDVLKNLLLQRNFQYTLKGKDLTVISFNNDSSRMARELLFKDLSLKDALQTLSKMMNINLILHESVEDKKVNFYVENLSLDELLDLLIETNGLVKKPHNDNTFIICDKESAGDFGKKQYRTFKLVNAKPEEIISMIKGSKSLSERIDTENFSVNERINSLSVYDSPENLSLIEKIIESADEKLKQAVIEVKLIEVNRTSAKKLGLSFSDYSAHVFDGSKLPEKLLGGTNQSPITAALDFLESENKVKVLSSPKIRAVHGKRASISIGKVYPIPYYKYENASNSYLGYIPQVYKEYRDVEVGIKLEVTPEISRDNEISMELNTTVDDMLGEANEDGQYKRSQRTTSTYVRVKNGETVVMGGLISANDDTTKQSPSVLNKIPLLKSLTTHNNTSAQSSEMIILVTPRLVNLDDADDEDVEDGDDIHVGVY